MNLSATSIVACSILSTLSTADLQLKITALAENDDISVGFAPLVIPLLNTLQQLTPSFCWTTVSCYVGSEDGRILGSDAVEQIIWNGDTYEASQCDVSNLFILNDKYDVDTLSLRRLATKAGPFVLRNIKVNPSQIGFALVFTFVDKSWCVMEGVAPISEFDTPAGVKLLKQIDPYLKWIFKSVARNRQHATHQLRLQFYGQLLSTPIRELQKGLQMLCDSWRTTTGADTAWFWLYSDTAEEWEVIAQSPSVPRESTGAPIRVTAGANSVLEYVYVAERPEVAEPSWKATLGGRNYVVERAAELSAQEIRQFICVPIPSPKELEDHQASSPQPNIKLRAGVCVHYRQTIPFAARHPNSTLKLMGQLSALLLLHCYEVKARTLLTALNKLSERHLSRSLSSPHSARRAFFDALLRLIQTQLDVRFVTIWIEDVSGKHLQCVSSTGLWDSSGAPLTKDKKAFYNPYEGWTGTTWATAERRLTKVQDRTGSRISHIAKWTESPPDETRKISATILYPIVLPPTESQRKGKCIGVIRCASPYHGSRPGPNNFDNFQLLALDFIATQAAPIIASLNRDVAVHKNTSRTKHDLLVPLGNIATMAEEIEEEVKRTAEERIALAGEVNRLVTRLEEYLDAGEDATGKRELFKRLEEASGLLKHIEPLLRTTILAADEDDINLVTYRLNDLPVNALKAVALLHQLDPDHDYLSSYRPSKTLLGSHIIARLTNSLQPRVRDAKQMSLRFVPFAGVIPSLFVDPVMIERALTNLIENACKYGQPNTDIVIRPKILVDGFAVEVINEGIPIRPEELSKVFDEEYRSPLARKVARGQGYGLKIVQEIMRLHGGSVQVSHVDGTTTVTLFFPRELQFGEHKEL